MARLSVHMLGPFQVTLDGDPVTGLRSDKVRALLAFLAVETEQPHRREKLAGLLWPDWPERSARASLRRALANLRQLIGDQQATPPFLHISRQTIQFNDASDAWIDVTAFTNLVGARGPPQQTIRQLEEAVQLYRGSFLEGFSVGDSPAFEEWALLNRERLHRLVMETLHRLAGCLEQIGEYERALQHAWRQVELDPWREKAHRQLMRLLALSGQRGAALAQYETCRRLLAQELGVEPAEETTKLYEQIRDGKLTAPVPFRPPALAPEPPPYKGLRYFDQADADLFFGRELLTAKLVAHLGPARGHRFLAVVGASGSGKSSIVRAGLIPALKRGEPLADGSLPPFGCTEWPVYVITPTAHPVEALAVSLTRDSESVTATSALIDDLARDPRSLHLYVRRLLPQPSSFLLLVVDQFEELFTLCRSEAERQAFVDNLMTAVETDGPTIVVIALRADFYAHCGQFAPLREALEKRQVYIGPMSADELCRAVTGPAERGGWAFEPGLVEFFLQEVGDEPGALPLLSHALLETWERRRGRTLTFSGYNESGGVRGAIAQTAERVLQGLEPEQQAIARNIFLRLTELGEGTQETRRRANLAELVPRPEEAPAVKAVLKTLADARLITTGEETVEVAHETLIREWPSLRGWLEEDRVGLRIHRHLTEAAQGWERLDREPGELYRGARLATASEWAGEHSDALNPLEREFLEASRELAQREEAEREAQRQRELEAAQRVAKAERQRAEEQTRATSRFRRLAGVLAAVFLLAVAAAVFARAQQQQAQVQARRAEHEARLATSRELAAAALNNLQVDPERSVLLALQAVSEAETLEAVNALHQAVPSLHLLLTLSGHSAGIYDLAVSLDGTRLATVSADGTAKVWDAVSGQELLTLIGHAAPATGVALSPDGRHLATASLDGTARVWDISTALDAGASTGQELLTLSGHAEQLMDVAWSPDGALLATAGSDGTARIWDVRSGQELRTLAGHSDVAGVKYPERRGVMHLAFSPEGARLATAGAEGTVKVWDVAAGQELLDVKGHVNEVLQVAFSPGGVRLATTGADGTTKVWDISPGPAQGQQLLVISQDQTAGGVAFSPDGTRLVTGSEDGTVRIWDSTSGRALLTLFGHTAAVGELAFSPDGSRLMTGSEDATVKVWDVSPGRELLTLVGPGGPFGARFSPDGKRLLTSAMGGTVGVWDATSGQELLTIPSAHSDAVTGSGFSPDGTRLATASWDGTAKVWDAGTGQALLILSGHTDKLWKVTFSPDGARLATASQDGTAKVWDSATGEELFTLAGHTGVVFSVAFSPDGTRLATASWDGTARMWDVASGRAVLTLRTGVLVFDVAFSPDGTRLAIANGDGTATVWDITSDEARTLLTLSGHTGWIIDVAFSPDGTRLATASSDGTAKVWDVSTGQELLTLSAHTDRVIAVSFSPDGRYLATGSYDSTARVHVLHLKELVALARSRVTRSLTEEECQRFLHMEQCPPTP